MPSAKTARSIEGDTVDLVCQRHYGRTKSVAEATLAANPGTAALGPILPIGTVLVMPIVEDEPAKSTLVRLWD